MNKKPLVIISEPWVVYEGKAHLPVGLGLIISERGHSVDLVGSEAQLEKDNSQCWKTEYIKRFETPESAMCYYSVSAEISICHVRDNFQRDFPGVFAQLPQICRELYLADDRGESLPYRRSVPLSTSPEFPETPAEIELGAERQFEEGLARIMPKKPL